MSKALITESKLTSLADAIRSKNGETDKYTPDQMADKIKSIGNTSKKFVWQNVTDAVKNYIDNVTYDSSDYSVSKIADYAPANPSVSDQYPVGKSLSLHAGTLSRKGYEQNVSAGSTIVYNDIPKKITPYTVCDSAGNISDVGVLKPDYFLRQIKTNGTNNVRDLGGWTCDGGTVKYGKLFRGGVVMANDVDLFLNQLGVKYELDLRGKTEASSWANLKDYIGYSVFDTTAWYTISDTQLWKNIFQVVFTCVKNNLPLYFHCASGADRTATVACVLEAMLGMSQSDIDKDYELTCFYTGTATDSAARRRNRSEWVGLIDAINAKTGTTFRDKAVRFCMECGYTIDDINNFRISMVDGTPETLTVQKYSVTNNLTNVTSDNTADTVDDLSSYFANIEPNKGYAINSVQVIMAGSNITSAVYSDGVINIPSVTGNIGIIAYAGKLPLNYINMIGKSTTTIGGTEIYNGGLGYKNGYRYNSSQVEKEHTGSFITGFIAVSKGDVLHFYGGLLDGNDGGLNTWLYDASGNMVTELTPYSLNIAGDTSNSDFVYNNSTLTIVNSKISAIKFTFVGSYSSKTIVTLNE